MKKEVRLAMADETFQIPEQNLEVYISRLVDRLEALRPESVVVTPSATLEPRVELRALELWRAVISECLATFFYVVLVTGAAGAASGSQGGSPALVVLAGSLAAGLAAATLTHCFRHISGHAHITDFNIATQLAETELATSMSGTKPYMSPEIFDCAADICVGYSYPVDWWSLGVVAFETMFGERPYDIHSHTGVAEVRQLFITPLRLPHGIDKQLAEMLRRLLCVSPGGRCSSLDELRKIPAMSLYDYDMVFQKRYKPEFCPPKDHLNCDPTFELEEMIVETKPLHKKKKRLAKQKSMREMHVGSIDLESQNSPTLETTLTNTIPEFITYNRYKELEKREIERMKLERQLKEEEWEKELATAMGESALSDKNKEKRDSEPKERSQDGCHILQVQDCVHFLNKSSSEEDKCVGGCANPESESSSKSCVDDSMKYCGCSGSSKRLTDNKKDNMENKKYNISHSDIIAIKKKHNKLFFDLGMFNIKQKSKSFSRSNSLRLCTNKDIIPEASDETLKREADLSDNVKNRIAHSPRIKNSTLHSDSKLNQKASTLMDDSEYQKSKQEVVPNYSTLLCSPINKEGN